MDLYPNELGKFPRDFIIESSLLILNNNYFEFNSEYYLQKKGTAMGTKFAPVYANLVLGFLEISLKRKVEDKVGTERAEEIMNNYFRFLDDIFIIWDTTDGDINIFYEILKSVDGDLSFTLDQSGSTVNFLDVQVNKTGTKVTTDVFYKDTDTHQYLNFRSCHPSHIKRNVPYNLARRLCTIVSETETLEIRLNELKSYLLKCNYPKTLIENGIKKAKKIPQSVLRKNDNIRNNEIEKIPFISTYNPNSENLFPTVSKVFNHLQTNPNTKSYYESNKLVNSNRQPSNLKTILTSARLKLKANEFKVTKCNVKNCDICNYLIEGPTFLFKKIDFTFRVNKNMSCNTMNCIYVLQCNGCQDLYIGETSNFRLRVNLHKHHVSKNCGLNVSRHIHDCARNKDTKFKIMPFYKVTGDDSKIRKEKEKYFITKFQPSLNANNYF